MDLAQELHEQEVFINNALNKYPIITSDDYNKVVEFHNSIVIQIAAYKDPELMTTIHSALLQADDPDRIYFAICYQSDDKDDLEKLYHIKNCKFRHVPASDARGSCFARYLCLNTVPDVEYTLHVDSHMRFIKHWDTKLIEQWEECNDDKAIITVYPPDYNTDELRNLDISDKAFDKPCAGGLNRAISFLGADAPFLKTALRCFDESYNKEYNSMGMFSAACYFFAKLDVDKDVPVDPYMLFMGDELPMSVRLFTYGYNIYVKENSYAYHKYNRQERSFPKTSKGICVEKIRVKNLFRIETSDEHVDLGIYDIGDVRTIRDFEKKTGIIFDTQFISIAALRGDFGKNDITKYVPSVTTMHTMDVYKSVTTDKILILMMSVNDDNIVNKINRCKAAASHPDRLEFLIYIKSQYLDNELMYKLRYECNVDFLYSSDMNVRYGKMLSDMIDYAREKILRCKYVLNTDSDTLFADKWDVATIEYHLKHGNKSVICNCLRINKGDSRNTFKNLRPLLSDIKWPYPVFRDGEIEILDLENEIVNNTLFFTDNFFFADISLLKDIEIDPRLNYSGFEITYAMRLFTNGYDIYYPRISYFYRTKSCYYLNVMANSKNDRSIISRIMGRYDNINDDLFVFEKYGAGNVRTLLQFYSEMGMSMRSWTFIRDTYIAKEDRDRLLK